MVSTSINNSNNVTHEAKYISNQLDFHATRIEDNTRDLHELMEKVDYLKEDVQKLTRMTQGSHFQDSLVAGNFQMEEISVGKPTYGQEARKG